MTQISRRRLSDRVNLKLQDLLYQLLGNRHSKKEFESSCGILFTATEKVMFSKRIALIYLLLKNIDQRTICDVLKVSKATVSKFALMCNQSPDVNKHYQYVLKREKLVTVLEEIWMLIMSPGTVGVSWGAARQRKWEHERKKELGM